MLTSTLNLERKRTSCLCLWAVQLPLRDVPGEKLLEKEIKRVVEISNAYSRHKRLNLITQQQKDWLQAHWPCRRLVSAKMHSGTWVQRDWTQHGRWWQMGWSACFTNCWSTGIFMQHHLRSLQRTARKKQCSSPIALLSDVGVKLPRKGQHRLKGKHLTYSGKHARRSTTGSDVNLYALVS